MSARLTLVLAAALLVFRAPSLVQPMGADQALYAYVGERIRAGGLPYRDAWDQKPPAIHFLYAGLRTLLPSDGVVPAADLARRRGNRVATLSSGCATITGGNRRGRGVGVSAPVQSCVHARGWHPPEVSVRDVYRRRRHCRLRSATGARQVARAEGDRATLRRHARRGCALRPGLCVQVQRRRLRGRRRRVPLAVQEVDDR